MSTISEPRFVDSPAILLAGMDQRYTFENRVEIPKLWERFGPYIGKIPNQVGGVAYGVCHHFDDSGFGYMAAVEISAAGDLLEGFTHMPLPAQRYAAFKHLGGLSTLSDSYMQIWEKWVPVSGQTLVDSPLIFERYSEDFDPESGTGDLELWMAIKD